MPENDEKVMDHSLARRVTVLEDTAAIGRLKARYMEGVDRCVKDPSAQNVEAVVGLFTADASADYAQFGTFQGHAQLTQFFQAVLPGAASWTRHQVMNPIVEVDGASATGRWYALVHTVFKSDPSAGAQPLWVTYEETYAKSGQGWKIRSIVVHFDAPAPPA